MSDQSSDPPSPLNQFDQLHSNGYRLVKSTNVGDGYENSDHSSEQSHRSSTISNSSDTVVSNVSQEQDYIDDQKLNDGSSKASPENFQEPCHQSDQKKNDGSSEASPENFQKPCHKSYQEQNDGSSDKGETEINWVTVTDMRKPTNTQRLLTTANLLNPSNLSTINMCESCPMYQNVLKLLAMEIEPRIENIVTNIHLNKSIVQAIRPIGSGWHAILQKLQQCRRKIKQITVIIKINSMVSLEREGFIDNRLSSILSTRSFMITIKPIGVDTTRKFTHKVLRNRRRYQMSITIRSRNTNSQN